MHTDHSKYVRRALAIEDKDGHPQPIPAHIEQFMVRAEKMNKDAIAGGPNTSGGFDRPTIVVLALMAQELAAVRNELKEMKSKVADVEMVNNLIRTHQTKK